MRKHISIFFLASLTLSASVSNAVIPVDGWMGGQRPQPCRGPVADCRGPGDLHQVSKPSGVDQAGEPGDITWLDRGLLTATKACVLQLPAWDLDYQKYEPTDSGFLICSGRKVAELKGARPVTTYMGMAGLQLRAAAEARLLIFSSALNLLETEGFQLLVGGQSPVDPSKQTTFVFVRK